MAFQLSAGSFGDLRITPRLAVNREVGDSRVANRINIESELWSDPRFIELCIKLGSSYAGIGAVVTAWVIAQRHADAETDVVPMREWVASNLPRALIDVGLAEERDGGVYVKGTSRHLAWLKAKRAAGQVGGKASAEARLKNYGTAQPGSKHTEASPKQDRSTRSGDNSVYELGTENQYPTEEVQNTERVLRESRSTRQAKPSKPNPLTLTLSLNTDSGNSIFIPSTTRKPDRIDRVLVEELTGTWGETLKHFGSTKDPKHDEIMLARLLQKYGVDRVRHALVGQRYEAKTERYDPGKHLSLRRLFEREHVFESLENLGAMNGKPVKNGHAVNAELEEFDRLVAAQEARLRGGPVA